MITSSTGSSGGDSDATPIPGRPGDPLRGRHVVLGVTGSIACYKAIEVTSRLVQAGAIVDVVLTKAATEFVTPLAFKAITGRTPYTDMFDPNGPDGEAHVELARRAEVMLIAMATGDIPASPAVAVRGGVIDTVGSGREDRLATGRGIDRADDVPRYPMSL